MYISVKYHPVTGNRTFTFVSSTKCIAVCWSGKVRYDVNFSTVHSSCLSTLVQHPTTVNCGSDDLVENCG